MYPDALRVATAVACVPDAGAEIVTFGVLRYLVPTSVIVTVETALLRSWAVACGWTPVADCGTLSVTVGVIQGYESPAVVRDMLATSVFAVTVAVAVGAIPVKESGDSMVTGGALAYPVGL